MKDKLDKFSKKFAKLLGNSRVRIVLLIIVVIIILGIILGIYRLTTNSGVASGSQVASIPSDIQSVPGGQKESQKYLSTLLQSNQLAAKNALSQGSSEIPTLVANSNDASGGSYKSQAVKTTGGCNCCQCSSCCGKGGTSKPGVDSVLNGLESSGAITPQTADAIRKLNGENLKPEEYANRLKELVAEGKLTPAQAKALLAAYKNDYKNHTQTPSDVVNGLLASGAISADTARTLKGLADKNLTPAQYAAELNKLVKEGKLSPAAAARLMAAYQKGYGKKSPDDVVDGLLNSGAISAATANELKKLNHSNLTPDQYAAELNKLVKEGKLTPAQAQALLAAYKKSHGESTAASPDDVVDGLLNSGAISPATASELKKLNNSNLTPDQYAAELNKLVKEGKLTPAQAQKLLAAYKLKHAAGGAAGANLPKPNDLVDQLAQSGQITAATAQKLKDLNGKNLSPEAYRRALQAMVANGELTQAQADKLASAYAAHHLKNASGTDAGLINQLQANGSLSASAAAQLKKLAAANASPQQYAAALKSLVESGQLDPATAAKLLQHYIGTHAKTGGKGLEGIRESQDKQDLERQVADFQKQAAEEQEAADKQTEANTQKIASAMRSQATQLISSWKAPKQLHAGNTPDKKSGSGDSSSAGGSSASGQSKSSGSQTAKQIIKAGDILFAVLNTSVNSDRPGAVMATIVAGKYKGAKLLGKLQLTPDDERVILTFTNMARKNWPASVNIQAVAINPDTAQTALASNVDHHYLLRYSALFASSFLQGYSQAVQQSGSTQVNSGFGSSTVTHPDLSPANKIMVGLGQVGQNASSAAQEEFNRKPTVTVDSGVGLGILFTNGVPQPDFESSKSTKTKGAK